MRRRYNRPQRPVTRRRPGLPLWAKLLVMVCTFAAVALAREYLPTPPSIDQSVKRIATRIAPDIFPPSAEQAASEADFRCRVARVNDGDTLRCQDGTRVRLHAVAARETNETCYPGHPCPQASAAAATATLKRMVDNEWLDCMTTGQSYNRVTAICWTPRKVEINCAMIESGTAVIWDRFNRETPICRHKRRGLGQTFSY